MAKLFERLIKHKKYDPKKPQRYYGIKFLTQKGADYSIDRHGIVRRSGGKRLKRDISGTKTDLIAGVKDDPNLYADFLKYIEIPNRKGKRGLDRLIKKHGQEIKEGLRLVASLKSEYIKKSGRAGFMSSPIAKITKMPSGIVIIKEISSTYREYK